MRKIFFLFFLVFGLLLQAQATHIVGGEFELRHLNNYNYRLTLNLYFDVVNGNPAANDASVSVDIYRKSDNVRIRNFVLPRTSQTLVNYTNPACAVASLVTDKILYVDEITLEPGAFSDPAGYYFIWERCCRNEVISNIIDPGGTGQAFVLEIPPVTKNGSQFINSSPILFPPLSDYACRSELFYFDFGGLDPDGDSLAYSMVNPFRGATSNTQPTIFPNTGAPYPAVQWAPGFGVNNQINGSVPLNINPVTGFLRVRPNSTGLFVFAVKCEEFRNGVKIGEVRRDFQLKVIECPQNFAPAITAQESNAPGINYVPGDTLHFSSDNNRCLNLIMTDPDPAEMITVTAHPINFTPPPGFSFQVTDIINELPGPDSLLVSFCLPKCMPPNDGVYLLDLVVKDDGCSLPKQDTIRITFTFEPPANQPPVISPGGSFSAQVGETLTFPFTAQDPDNHPMTITVEGNVPDLAAYGFSLGPISGTGPITFAPTWTPNCNSATLPEDLEVWVIVQDQVCNIGKADSTKLLLHTLYQNIPPALSIHPVGDTTQQFPQVIEIVIDTEVTFDILGRDFDPNLINLDATSEGFNLSLADVNFSPGSSATGEILRNFSWKPNCNSGGPGTYKITFNLNETTCKAEDTSLTVTIKVLEREPEVAFNPVNIFTPNGDGFNDVFEMPTLPLDACGDAFVQMRLFTRWGTVIYSNPSRNFRWDGAGYPEGIYYYQIEFQKRKYKGYVTLTR